MANNQGDPVVAQWRQDPEFNTLPPSQQTAIVTNYFNSNYADSAFHALPQGQQSGIIQNFISSNLGSSGNVRMPVSSTVRPPAPPTTPADKRLLVKRAQQSPGFYDGGDSSQGAYSVRMPVNKTVLPMAPAPDNSPEPMAPIPTRQRAASDQVAQATGSTDQDVIGRLGQAVRIQSQEQAQQQQNDQSLWEQPQHYGPEITETPGPQGQIGPEGSPQRMLYNASAVGTMLVQDMMAGLAGAAAGEKSHPAQFYGGQADITAGQTGINPRTNVAGIPILGTMRETARMGGESALLIPSGAAGNAATEGIFSLLRSSTPRAAAALEATGLPASRILHGAATGVIYSIPQDPDTAAQNTKLFAAFEGAAAGLHALGPAAAQYGDMLTKDIVQKTGAPETVYFSPQKIRNVMGASAEKRGGMSPDEYDLYQSLNLKPQDIRRAVTDGLTIKLPTEVAMRLVDKPYWAKVKGAFGVAPTDIKLDSRMSEMGFSFGHDSTMSPTPDPGARMDLLSDNPAAPAAGPRALPSAETQGAPDVEQPVPAAPQQGGAITPAAAPQPAAQNPGPSGVAPAVPVAAPGISGQPAAAPGVSPGPAIPPVAPVPGGRPSGGPAQPPAGAPGPVSAQQRPGFVAPAGARGVNAPIAAGGPWPVGQQRQEAPGVQPQASAPSAAIPLGNVSPAGASAAAPGVAPAGSVRQQQSAAPGGFGQPAGGEPVVVGRSRDVTAVSGGTPERFPARYELRELSDIQASHLPLEQFRQNPAYPAGVQDRPYHTSQTHQDQVRGRAAQFDAAHLVNTGPTAETGPTIVTRDGVVLGGNNRKMILDLLTEKHPEKFAQYVQALRDEAPAFGLNPQDVDRFQNPVLVRSLDFASTERTPQELGRISGVLNKTAMTGQDSISRGVAAAKGLSKPTISDFASGLSGYDTLRNYLDSPHASQSLVPRLEHDGVLDAQNRDQYLVDGRLTPQGKDTVEAAVRGFVIPDNDLLQRFRKANADELKTFDFALPHIAYAKAMGEDWVSPAMSDVIRLFLDYNAHKVEWAAHNKGAARKYDPDFYLRQPTLLSGVEKLRGDRLIREQFRALVNLTPREFATAWKGYSSALREVKIRAAMPGVELRSDDLRKIVEDVMGFYDQSMERAPKTHAEAMAQEGGQNVGQSERGEVGEPTGNSRKNVDKNADKIADKKAVEPQPSAPMPLKKVEPAEAPEVPASLKRGLRDVGLKIEGRLSSKSGRPYFDVRVTGAAPPETKAALKAAGGRFGGKVWHFSDKASVERALEQVRKLDIIDKERRAEFERQLNPAPKPEPSAATPHGGGTGIVGVQTRMLRDKLDKMPSVAPERPQNAVSRETMALIKRGEGSIPIKILGDQVRDIGKIATAFDAGRKAFVLASDPGMGKTFVLAGALREIGAKSNVPLVWITQNRRLIEQIKSDIQPFGLSDRVRFLTYNDLSQAQAGKKNIGPAFDGTVIAWDEGHAIKNTSAGGEEAGAARADFGQKMMAKAKFNILASATPFENPTQMGYLAATGVFDQLKGMTGLGRSISDSPFYDFALAHGAGLRKVRAKGGRERQILEWTRGETQEERATQNANAIAARNWLDKQGMFSQREMRMEPGKVRTSLSRVPADARTIDMADRFADAMHEAVVAAGNNRILRRNLAGFTTNTLKRIMENAKVPAAIDQARAAMDEGRQAVIFVETRSQKDLSGADYPEMEKAMEFWSASGASGKPPYTAFQLAVSKALHDSGIEIALPSTVERLREGIGADNVAVYTGDRGEGAANKDLDAWLGGRKPVLVATMAKGGTGLSLHSRNVGDAERTLIGLNMPWTATTMKQVLGRVVRLGMTKPADIRWLFLDHDFERMIASKVGGRMQDMGAVVGGEVPKLAQDIEAFDFEAPTEGSAYDSLEPMGSRAPSAPAEGGQSYDVPRALASPEGLADLAARQPALSKDEGALISRHMATHIGQSGYDMEPSPYGGLMYSMETPRGVVRYHEGPHMLVLDAETQAARDPRIVQAVLDAAPRQPDGRALVSDGLTPSDAMDIMTRHDDLFHSQAAVVESLADALGRVKTAEKTTYVGSLAPAQHVWSMRGGAGRVTALNPMAPLVRGSIGERPLAETPTYQKLSASGEPTEKILASAFVHTALRDAAAASGQSLADVVKAIGSERLEDIVSKAMEFYKEHADEVQDLADDIGRVRESRDAEAAADGRDVGGGWLAGPGRPQDLRGTTPDASSEGAVPVGPQRLVRESQARLTAEQVQAAVDAMDRGRFPLSQVQVAPSWRDLPPSLAIQARDNPGIYALYDKGSRKMHLIADRVGSRGDVVEAAMHAVQHENVHRGVDAWRREIARSLGGDIQAAGEKIDQTLTEAYRANKDAVDALASGPYEGQFDMETEEGRARATEEFLADQEDQAGHWWDRYIAAVRDFMRRVLSRFGKTLKWGDTETRDFLRRAREASKRAEDEVAQPEEPVAEAGRPGDVQFGIFKNDLSKMTDKDRTFALRVHEYHDQAIFNVNVTHKGLQERVKELAGVKHDSVKARSLDMAMLIYRDLKNSDASHVEDPMPIEDRLKRFREWADEKAKTLHGDKKLKLQEFLRDLDHAQKLTPEQKDFVDSEMDEKFRRTTQEFQSMGMLKGTPIKDYVYRKLTPPDDRPAETSGVPSVGGSPVKAYSTALMRRKYPTLLDAMMDGYELAPEVRGITNSWREITADAVTIAATKRFIQDGLTSGVFTAKKVEGWLPVQSEALKVWRPTGSVKTIIGDTPGLTDTVMAKNDKIGNYSRKFFITQPEVTWAVRAPGRKAAVAVFDDEASARQFAKQIPGGSVEFRQDIDVFEKVPLYAPPQIATALNLMTRGRSGGFFDTPLARGLSYLNGTLKPWMLLGDFFHHQSLMRSWTFGGPHDILGSLFYGGAVRDAKGLPTIDSDKSVAGRIAGLVRGLQSSVSWRHAITSGLDLIHERNPVIQTLVGKGLTFPTMSDMTGHNLTKARGMFETLMRAMGSQKAADALAVGKILRSRSEHFLFGTVDAGLKAQWAYMYFMHQMRHEIARGGAPNVDRIAEQVADAANTAFGGQHLGRAGRNSDLTKALHLLFLAPDWAITQLKPAVSAVPGLSRGLSKILGEMPPPPGSENFYRRYLAKQLISAAIATVMAQILLNSDTEEGPFQMYREQFSDWNTAARLRWAMVDVTRVYRGINSIREALGMEPVELKPGNRYMFNLPGFMIAPLRLFEIGRFLSAKGSPLLRMTIPYVTGQDWRDRPYKSVGDLVDAARHPNRATSKELVRGTRDENPQSISQFPAITLANIRDMQPLQIGQLLRWAQGEEDGITAAIKSLGVDFTVARDPNTSYKEFRDLDRLASQQNIEMKKSIYRKDFDPNKLSNEDAEAFAALSLRRMVIKTRFDAAKIRTALDEARENPEYTPQARMERIALLNKLEDQLYRNANLQFRVTTEAIKSRNMTVDPEKLEEIRRDMQTAP